MNTKALISLVILFLLLFPGHALGSDGGATIILFAVFLFLLVGAIGLAAVLSSFIKLQLSKTRYAKRLGLSLNAPKSVTISEILVMTIVFILVYGSMSYIDLRLLSNFLIIPDTLAIWYNEFVSVSKNSPIISYGELCVIFLIAIPFYFIFAANSNFSFLDAQKDYGNIGAFKKLLFSAILCSITPILLFILVVPRILMTAYPKDIQLNHMIVQASRLAHTRLTSALINEGADINYRYHKGKTPLMSVFLFPKLSSWNQHEAIKQLLDHGAEVNARDQEGLTALMYASKPVWVKKMRDGKDRDMYETVGYKCVELLLNHGAIIDMKDNRGMTALMLAVKRGNLWAVKQLISEGAQINHRDNKGRTALTMAANNYYRKKIIQMLIDNDADINAKDKSGKTALMVASSEGHPEIVKLFINNGADVNARDENGNTALTLALTKNKKSVSDLLIKCGAKE